MNKGFFKLGALKDLKVRVIGGVGGIEQTNWMDCIGLLLYNACQLSSHPVFSILSLKLQTYKLQNCYM